MFILPEILIFNHQILGVAFESLTWHLHTLSLVLSPDDWFDNAREEQLSVIISSKWSSLFRNTQLKQDKYMEE